MSACASWDPTPEWKKPERRNDVVDWCMACNKPWDPHDDPERPPQYRFGKVHEKCITEAYVKKQQEMLGEPAPWWPQIAKAMPETNEAARHSWTDRIPRPSWSEMIPAGKRVHFRPDRDLAYTACGAKPTAPKTTTWDFARTTCHYCIEWARSFIPAADLEKAIAAAREKLGPPPPPIARPVTQAVHLVLLSELGRSIVMAKCGIAILRDRPEVGYTTESSQADCTHCLALPE